VPKEGFALDTIRSAGLKGTSAASRLRGLALLAPSALDAWRIVTSRRPDLVIGVGGYSAGPVVLLAAVRGVPTMVLEQNAVPGLTNRLLARVIRAAAVTYERTLPFFRGKGFVSGNPVRPEFFVARGDASAERGASNIDARTPKRDRVLVLGGSQGAHAINMAMVAAAPELVRRHAELAIVHQTGERDLEVVREGYRAAGIAARAEPCLDGVAGEMKQATLVISRAGATTLAELAAIGLPAVLVPFPGAADDHQRENARVLEEAGAAVTVDQSGLNGERLAGVVSGLLGDAARLDAMGAAMRRFARPDAAARIVERALQLAGRP
jgi:UDP-N-acetylglucosamine--N-acetylmuramyl-(pentapeptide) pyrophosphoryl-undecaprenol N-acetylglucosamine transferase